MSRTPEENLREWFKKNAAALPWRLLDFGKKRDPYKVWISETMLQQTQVATVKDYFIRWMGRFPDIVTLANADEAEVFKYWQGLGYYSRARNLLKTAKILCAKNPLGEMPQNRKELEALPGIGSYTAGAILSLAFHKREAILDGNLVRIFSRLYELDFLPTDKGTGKVHIERGDCGGRENCASVQGKKCAEIYWDIARSWADSSKGYMHNEALMELGRTVCKVRSPLCDMCPLKAACRAFAHNRTQEFPPAKKHVQREWHGTALVVESADGKYLAVSGGQAFLKGQLSLPHFESPRNATIGLPSEAEAYINADDVASVTHAGKFRHNITIHKIECDVLHIKLKTHSAKTASTQNTDYDKSLVTWIPKAKAIEAFANSFSLKALKNIKC